MKKKIALVTGGYSGESVISYKSATTIGNHLDKELFDVYRIDVNPQGWFYEAADGQKAEINKNDFSLTVDGKKISFDAAFIGMHGTPGEDGKLQGYFDVLGIPYTSCDAATSAITFNKRYTVAVAKMAGIAVANSLHLFKHSPVPAAEVADKLKMPVFVKPNNGGSSIGMSRVDKREDLEGAIAKAFKEDNQVLVEEMIQGREFTVGVFKTRGNIIVLPLTEVKADASKEFFDFEAKYQGKSTETTPAVVDEEIANKVRAAAKKIYEVFNCRFVVRIDFIYNEATGLPHMLEINTIPGQTEASIVPQQVKAMGWSLTEFYTKLTEECFQ
ncbi:D-alanine--D-alanine ligase [Terrimonas sp. NA20]|uniref:D-alanine--D-alanine ligase n=1 Tax=Terrimonas ginsenosidimutans TaxID=2908004 RepID=A0ABS9KTG4_9BACT|nr:D-alanine--D-alanine ligase [Terrimonas ginsenosidimutans]MCG2615623.1 D-alanine--D-alanine ligase [Terrimonas ginsenosidimutans]